jgi:hypothetical protein
MGVAEARHMESQEGMPPPVDESVMPDTRVPSDLHVYSSDFKAAKQSAHVLTHLWAQVCVFGHSNHLVSVPVRVRQGLSRYM